MDANGQIEVNARVVGEELCIGVKDQGIGLDSESLPTIFDMFSQVKSALDRSEGGLGIGLALVKGLVTLHGGRIEAASEGLGRGSEFRVWLPIPKHQEAHGKQSGFDGFRLPITARRVLIVDDNRDAAQTLGLLLEQSGHMVRIAHDGPQALLAADDFRPEVAVLDIGLPKLNGYELAQAIRGESWGQHMVLVALTGWGQRDDKLKARQAGFNGHLTKPVDPDQVNALISVKLDHLRWHG
jgi:CheY-like chemotaxis protein